MRSFKTIRGYEDAAYKFGLRVCTCGYLIAAKN